jgi:hypothetical protein
LFLWGHIIQINNCFWKFISVVYTLRTQLMLNSSWYKLSVSEKEVTVIHIMSYYHIIYFQHGKYHDGSMLAWVHCKPELFHLFQGANFKSCNFCAALFTHARAHTHTYIHLKTPKLKEKWQATNWKFIYFSQNLHSGRFPFTITEIHQEFCVHLQHWQPMQGKSEWATLHFIFQFSSEHSDALDMVYNYI